MIAPQLRLSMTEATVTIAFRIDVKVIVSISMPLRAVSFLSVLPGPTLATEQVYPLRHRFQVSEVATGRRSTQMVKLQPLWDRPHVVFIDDPVNEVVLAAIADARVTIRGAASWPERAAILLQNKFGENVPDVVLVRHDNS
jgi:hypothetical protein